MNGQIIFILWRESVEALLVIGILSSWLSHEHAPRRAGLLLWGGIVTGLALAIGFALVGPGVHALITSYVRHAPQSVSSWDGEDDPLCFATPRSLTEIVTSPLPAPASSRTVCEAGEYFTALSSRLWTAHSSASPSAEITGRSSGISATTEIPLPSTSDRKLETSSRNQAEVFKGANRYSLRPSSILEKSRRFSTSRLSRSLS